MLLILSGKLVFLKLLATAYDLLKTNLSNLFLQYFCSIVRTLSLFNVNVSLVYIHITRVFQFSGCPRLDPPVANGYRNSYLIVIKPHCLKNMPHLTNGFSPGKSLRKSSTRHQIFVWIHHLHSTSFMISFFWQWGSFCCLCKQYLSTNNLNIAVCRIQFTHWFFCWIECSIFRFYLTAEQIWMCSF